MLDVNTLTKLFNPNLPNTKTPSYLKNINSRISDATQLKMIVVLKKVFNLHHLTNLTPYKAQYTTLNCIDVSKHIGFDDEKLQGDRP